MARKLRSPVIYFIAPVNGGAIKIGVTRRPEQRFAAIQAYNPSPLEVLATVAGSNRDEEQLT